MNEKCIEPIKNLLVYCNCKNTGWDYVNNITTLIALIISIFSLIVSWKVYIQTGKLHKENLNLTKKIHEDSLTPYISIKKIKNCISFYTQRFPEMFIETVNVNDYVVLNERKQIELNELEIKIYVEFLLVNMSSQPSEIMLKYNYLGYDDLLRDSLNGLEEKIVKIERTHSLLNEGIIKKVTQDNARMTFELSYVGPGLSARDTIVGELQLNYDAKKIANDSELIITQRNREYKLR